jgi:hypothetical protein
MAAEAASGAGDHNNAESGLSWKIKVFLVFFFHLLQDGIVCQPTDVFFIIFFSTKER